MRNEAPPTRRPDHVTDEPAPTTAGRWLRRLGVLIVSLGGLLVGFVVLFAVNASSGINDGYAHWGAHNMLVEFMREHGGRWPRSWDDLEPQFRESNGKVGGWSYERYQSRVWIDFEADPGALRAASEAAGAGAAAPFNVVRSRRFWQAPWVWHWGGGADQMLHDFFVPPPPRPTPPNMPTVEIAAPDPGPTAASASD